MYIVELIYKLLNKEKFKIPPEPRESPEDVDYSETCEHIFLPIDSTKKVLACSKCGFIIKVDDNPKENKNFFMK